MSHTPYFVYILECADGSLYTGITTDVKKRLAKHKNGTAAKYTRTHGIKTIRHTESYKNRSEALKREAHIKTMSRQEKLSLIGTTLSADATIE